MIRCKNAARYSGLLMPRCNRGRGCDACWRKWANKLNEIINPRVWSSEEFDKLLKEVYAPKIKRALEKHTNLLKLFTYPSI